MRRLAALIIITLVLAGCGSAIVKDSQTAPPVITLWHYYQGDAAKGLEQARQELRNTNPPYDLELVYMPSATFFTRLTQAQAAGKGPDLFLIDQQSIPALSGAIQPIDRYLDPNPYFQSAVQALSFNGSILAVPKAVRTPLLTYNKDLAPNPPAGWEQILDQAGKITQGRAVGIAGDLSNLFLTGSLYSAYGARFFTPDLRPDLDNAESQNFLRAVAGRPGLAGLNDPQVSRNLIAGGATPFALIDSSEINAYKALGKNLGFSAIPGPGGKEGKSYIRAEGFAVSSASNFPKEATAAAMYLTSPQAMNLYAPTDFPAQPAAYEQKPLQDNPEAQLIKRLAANGLGYPQDTRSTTLMAIVSQMIKDTLSGADPAAATQAAQDRGQRSEAGGQR